MPGVRFPLSQLHVGLEPFQRPVDLAELFNDCLDLFRAKL